MKLYKLSQGSTFENLKTFIYVTNEYGVPSAEFVDAFIDQFGKIILNGNFTLNKSQLSQLDKLWQTIVKECEHNNIEYNENYGSLFYIVLCQKSVLEIKKDCEQYDWNKLSEQDKLDLLKQFILDFDKYIMDGIDMAQLYFENTPELVKTDEYNREYIEIQLKNYEADARGRLYSDGSVVIYKNSKVQPEKSSSSVNNDRKLYTKDLILLDDLRYNSVSGAGNFVCGQAINGWVHWKNVKGQIVDIYRYKDGNVQAQANVDKRAEDAARINALINQDTNTDIVNTVNKQKYNYKLTNEMYIGHELTITESVDDIKSSYKVKVVDNVNVQLADTNLIININKFIEEIENRNVQLTITMGFFKFEDIYMEEK